MGQASISLKSGVVVVFEGLDGAGKSTQLARLEGALEPQSALLAHMPSGFHPFTRRLYDALEAPGEKPTWGLAAQLAHLSCHSDSMATLVGATQSKALVLDRWWWSTLAYGWYGGPVQKSGLSMASFCELIDAIWHEISASVVFVFLEQHQVDSNNSQGVEAGYKALIAEHEDVAVVVRPGDAESVHRFIVDTLLQRKLATAYPGAQPGDDLPEY